MKKPEENASLALLGVQSCLPGLRLAIKELTELEARLTGMTQTSAIAPPPEVQFTTMVPAVSASGAFSGSRKAAMSEEVKRKISEAAKKKWQSLTPGQKAHRMNKLKRARMAKKVEAA